MSWSRSIGTGFAFVGLGKVEAARAAYVIPEDVVPGGGPGRAMMRLASLGDV